MAYDINHLPPRYQEQARRQIEGMRRPPGKHKAPGKPRTMNKTERRYADILDRRKLAGEVLIWLYEPVKLRIGECCFYSPDFMVLLPGGTVEFHETKGGFVRDDATVKIKAAADKFPWRFRQAQYKKGQWTIREIRGAIDLLFPRESP